jgi:ribose transport system substrate-binding protein
MRRRLAAALIVPLATLLLAGAAPTKPWKITYIQGVTGNPFYTSVACGGADAAKRLGAQFDSQGPQQYQPQLQMRVLDAVIASQPDGILFTADDPVAMTPSCRPRRSASRSCRSTAT